METLNDSKNIWSENISRAISFVFKDLFFVFLALSLALNLLALDYFVFSKTTTFTVFFSSNTAFYNWSSIILTAIIAILFGIALSLVVFILKRKITGAASGTSHSVLGAVFSAVSSSCPVCGAWLLPLLGIAGSLTAFPFQGLEIKLLSIFLLGFSVNESAKSILGIYPALKTKIFTWNKGRFAFNLNKETLPQLKPALIIILAVFFIYALPNISQEYKLNFSQKSSLVSGSSTKNTSTNDADSQSLFNQVNPKNGYTIKAKYGDIGPKLLESGAIDLKKFKSIYDQSGSPLTEEQIKILTQGLDKEITINQDNAYFLINFFWALGLANKNPILDEGQITKYGENKINSFASTGGWTAGTKDIMDIYSKSRIIILTQEQQDKVDEVASNAFRPCCNNSTAFPDCNHGMALLAVLELMAANNASLFEMYETSKYFNGFWFPQQYLDLALYFKTKDGLDFKDIDPKIIVGPEYSSGSGWSKTKKWLSDNDLIEKAPQGGGGCGV